MSKHDSQRRAFQSSWVTLTLVIVAALATENADARGRRRMRPRPTPVVTAPTPAPTTPTPTQPTMPSEPTAPSQPTTPPTATTVGPLGPVGPIANVSCTGVTLKPGDRIQSAIDANPVGTVFCLSAGTYANQTLVPKVGNQFIGALGAILDGKNTTIRAVQGSGTNVVIKNLVIKNYAGGAQVCTIFGDAMTGLTLTNNEIAYNAGCGVSLADNIQMRFNNIHHNLQLGFGGHGKTGRGMVIDSNEIAFNNYTDKYDPAWEAGGVKLWATIGAQLTHNYAHDNHGPGLWADTDNMDTLYAYNRVENNWGGGIFHEVSYNASIHHNVVKNNANLKYCPGWLWCSGIQIAASGGVNGGMIEIYENEVIADGAQNGNAIGLIQQDRSGDPCIYGPCVTQNVYVHHNKIDLSKGGGMGGVEDVDDRAMFKTRNNRFDYNTYVIPAGEDNFAWNDVWYTLSAWKVLGFDLR